MDASTILHQLTHAEGLPREALAAASEQRGEMAPLFMDAIDSYLAAPASGRAEPTPLFFIFHLLGEWREKSAYGRLASLLRCRPDEVDAIAQGVEIGVAGFAAGNQRFQYIGDL